MKFLPVLVHAISFIYRSGGKADLTSEDRERSMSSKYQASLVNGKHVYDVQTMHLCYNKSVYIFNRALVIIYRCLTLTSEDSDMSITDNLSYHNNCANYD